MKDNADRLRISFPSNASQKGVLYEDTKSNSST